MANSAIQQDPEIFCSTAEGDDILLTPMCVVHLTRRFMNPEIPWDQNEDQCFI